MIRTIHMCISVRGLLSRTDSELKKIMKSCTKDDGTNWSSVHEFRNDLFDLIASGKEVMPMGECDNFDYKKGCQGHEVKEITE